ncbi:protein tyrosine phosphatase domain-containing protein 1 [Trichomycterus rosablanca]|uniref:protein tyrosine phosphatase domain-containing protein 1 n=1 Tax=Trichomycterus rosablanca TaxID=2290929 RepID=UPI002F360CCF
MGETLRHVIPGHMQCSMACGGRACKYENPSRWSNKEQAIRGLYSSWITDNLLAMARPSTENIDKYNIIEQFLKCGLKTIINLQRPGEHASCGHPLEPESGFTYRPEVFMEAGIYFYNFGWKDYGVASLATILDMVKVMSFAMQEGKMAIHCHAGLGRTGVLLACYLVFKLRMSADQAILFVRAKRPSSIQTRGQLLCVREFARFVAPLRSVFSNAEPRTHTVTLSQYLTRQRHLLHGYEARQMKHVPKIVHVICRLLLDVAENRQVTEEKNVIEIPDLTAEVEKTVSQQALLQLGKEIWGKGDCVNSPRSLESSTPPLEQFDPLWSVWSVNEDSKAQHLRRLSVSDSALNCLGSRTKRLHWHPGHVSNLLGKRCTSQNRLVPESPKLQPSRPLLTYENGINSKPSSLTGSSSSINKCRKEPERAPRSPLFRKRIPLKEIKRTRSLGFSKSSTATTTDWQTAEKWSQEGQSDQVNNKPFISMESGDVHMFQTELALEDRHVQVAKALATDAVGENLRNAISTWQTELNSREGAWERLYLERDPLLLSSLMWSWLEQLKEPVITKEDVEELTSNSHKPLQALNVLEKGNKQTLLCVLDCAAHLMKFPDELEAAVLHRTIKAFTRVTSDSVNGQQIYKSLVEILSLVLNDMRRKALEELHN